MPSLHHMSHLAIFYYTRVCKYIVSICACIYSPITNDIGKIIIINIIAKCCNFIFAFLSFNSYFFLLRTKVASPRGRLLIAPTFQINFYCITKRLLYHTGRPKCGPYNVKCIIKSRFFLYYKKEGSPVRRALLAPTTLI